MQFKLLNFHKMLANFALNLLGVFVPLIIYQTTGTISYSIIYLVMHHLFRYIFSKIFRKKIEKQPQLYLLIRVLPIIIYAGMVIMIDYNLWLAISMIAIFGGMQESFKYLSNEVILNYSSLNREGKSLGITRVFEASGVVLSVILGGLFLDNLSRTVVVVIVILLYIASIIPLVIYYLKYRNSANFNKEAISNAYLTYGEKQVRTKHGRTATKRILLNYFIMYSLMCVVDSFIVLFNLYVFIQNGQFLYASMVAASVNTFFAIGSYVAGKIGQRYDTTWMVTISAIVIGVLLSILPHINSGVLLISTFAVIGALWPFSVLFLLDRMLVKTRILGVSNKALYLREVANNLGKGGGFALAIFGVYPYVFILIGAAYALYGLLVPSTEEKTRKLLIDYLEN